MKHVIGLALLSLVLLALSLVLWIAFIQWAVTL